MRGCDLHKLCFHIVLLHIQRTFWKVFLHPRGTTALIRIATEIFLQAHITIANKSNKASFTIIHLGNPPTQSFPLPLQLPERTQTVQLSFRAVWLHG